MLLSFRSTSQVVRFLVRARPDPAGPDPRGLARLRVETLEDRLTPAYLVADSASHALQFTNTLQDLELPWGVAAGTITLSVKGGDGGTALSSSQGIPKPHLRRESRRGYKRVRLLLEEGD